MAADIAATRLIMDEARRLLDRQEADLDTLRSRVATLLTGSSIVAAVFGATLSDTADVDCPRTVAFVLFGLTVAMALWIMLPRKWAFSHELTAWLERVRDNDEPRTEFDIAYNLARSFDDYRKENAPKLRRLQWCFAVACLLLGGQVVAWAFAIN
jgi:hypothetical protein